jgi:rubrerythrin
MYQVLSGLNEGERVVASGQFMLDSESQLNEAIEKMREPGAVPIVETVSNANPKRVESATPRGGTNMVYVCPMPEHVSITYDHPGTCPICGMSLVPVTHAELKQLQPGGKVLYYTCPMPEHASIHEDNPGKCPICGMTLIPVMEAPKPGAPLQTNAPPESGLPILYTCPMHIDVVSEKPGNCPKCGMELVPTTTVPNGKIAEDKWREEHAQ